MADLELAVIVLVMIIIGIANGALNAAGGEVWTWIKTLILRSKDR